MKVIGLTGGTGSGKSTVAAYLREKGCYIIDADKISRTLTAKGGEALGPIKERFGKEVFSDDGSLDRKKLGSIVFADEKKLRILEEITIGIPESHNLIALIAAVSHVYRTSEGT